MPRRSAGRARSRRCTCTTACNRCRRFRGPVRRHLQRAGRAAARGPRRCPACARREPRGRRAPGALRDAGRAGAGHGLRACRAGPACRRPGRNDALALSRGAGLDGLAGMPRQIERHGVSFHRPLLDVHGSALREWIAASGTAHIDDPSNADLRYTRNRIRLQVLPALAIGLAAVSRHLRAHRRAMRPGVRACWPSWPQQDLAAAGSPPALAALRALPRERLANALRHWLKREHGCGAERGATRSVARPDRGLQHARPPHPAQDCRWLRAARGRGPALVQCPSPAVARSPRAEWRPVGHGCRHCGIRILLS